LHASHNISRLFSLSLSLRDKDKDKSSKLSQKIKKKWIAAKFHYIKFTHLRPFAQSQELQLQLLASMKDECFVSKLRFRRTLLLIAKTHT
jgi:hypothetical protein